MKNKNRGIWLFTGVLIMLMAGTVYTWTIISRSIAASYPDWSAQTLSMTFTITMMGYALGGMASGIVLKKTGPRLILAAAAVLFTGGLMLASFAQSPALLYCGFGAMSGFAAGLCYNSTVSTVSAWFPDKQGIASGTLLAGFGLSSFIAGKLFAAFAPADGSLAWQTGLRILAVLVLAVLILGIVVMRFPRAGEVFPADNAPEAVDSPKTEVGSPKNKVDSPKTEVDSPKDKLVSPKKKNAREPACDIPTTEMLGKASFWLFYIWISLLTACGLLLVSHASGIAAEVDRTLTDGTIATAVGMISILNAAGRICTGTVFDRYGYRVTMLMVNLTFGIAAGLMILALHTGTFALLIIGFVAGGFAYGGVASIIPPLIADFYGRTWYATNLSLVPTNVLFTSFAAVLAGRIYDRTQSFQGSLYLLLGSIALSLLLSFLIHRPGEK